MKYYKITLPENSTGIIYPKNYQLEVGDNAADHLYYNDDAGLKLLLLIPDEKAKDIIRDNIIEITEAEAKTISETYEQRKEKITDEAKIRRIELKIKLAQPLTESEEKAIDPDDETPGFGKEPILADRIETLKTKLVAETK